jgi:hypothetical protein
VARESAVGTAIVLEIHRTLGGAIDSLSLMYRKKHKKEAIFVPLSIIY